MIWRNPFRQALLLLRRRQAARRIGVPFTRSIHWKTPPHVLIHGALKDISAPSEPGTDLAFLDILIDDCYGLRRAERPVERIVDIGGHSGFFSLHAKMLYPAASVHAYEPNPTMASYIERQAQVCGFQWFPEAVSDKSGTVAISSHPDSVNARTVDAPGGTIPMIALSTVLARIGGSIDFLKMDCEGAEWSIFKDKASLATVRRLGMEYHLFEGHTLAELTETVMGLGFKIIYLKGDGPDYGRLWAKR